MPFDSDEDFIAQEAYEQGREDSKGFIAKGLLIHSRALAAHCECLALNAHNCAEACRNGNEYYPPEAYTKILGKWNLINDKGEPLI